MIHINLMVTTNQKPTKHTQSELKQDTEVEEQTTEKRSEKKAQRTAVETRKSPRTTSGGGEQGQRLGRGRQTS